MGVYTNTMRYTGTSGVDVESMVQSLMKAEGMKADKLYKQKTRLEWQQNAIRTLGQSTRTFRDNYLAFSSGSLITNMRASSTYLSKSIKGTVSGGGTLSQGATSNILKLGSNSTIKIDSNTAAGDYKVKIDSVAAKQKNLGTTMSSDAVGTEAFDFDAANIEAGDYLDLTVNGSKKRITFTQKEIDDVNALADKQNGFKELLQTKIDNTFGTIGSAPAGSKVLVSLTSDDKMSLGSNPNIGSTFSVTYDSGVGSATSVKTTGGVLDGVSKDGAFTAIGTDSYTFTVNGDTANPINVDVKFGEGGVTTKEQYLKALNDELAVKKTNVKASMGSDGNITFKSATGDGTVTVDDVKRNITTPALDGDGNAMTSSFGLAKSTSGSVLNGVNSGGTAFTTSGKDTYTINGKSFEIEFGENGATDATQYMNKVNLALESLAATEGINVKATMGSDGNISFSNADSSKPLDVAVARTNVDGSPMVDVDGNNISAFGMAGKTELTGTASIAGKLGLEKTNLSSTFDTNTVLNSSDEIIYEKLTIGDKSYDIEIKAGATYKDVMNSVSTATKGKASLTFNSTSNSFTLSSNVAGSVNKMELQSGGILESKFNIPPKATTDAADASVEITIPGSNTPQKIVRDTNSFSYGGITFNLDSGLQDSLIKNELDEDGNLVLDVDGNPKKAYTPMETTITVGSDTSSAFDNIKGFLAAYNTLLGDLNTATSTTRAKSGSYSYYEPLTEEEKTGLSDSEIEKLENKAKQGQLYGNDELERLQSRMREIATTTVTMSDGSKMSLSSIGITTGDYSTGGRLYITDEEKLKNALANNAENVAKLFTDGEKGVAEKLYKAVDEAVGTEGYITKNVGFDDSVYKNNNIFSNQIKERNQQLADLNDYLTDKENYYYKMFSYMEQSISKANSQMASLGY